MKKYLLFVVMLGFVSYAFAQGTPTTEKKNGPVITFEKKTHDFGDIHQGDKVEHTFHFTNTGNEPLIITNVQVSCGCTTPKGWPRDPIPPGGKGEVTIGFNSTGKMGRQNKPVTIISNAVNTDGNQVTFTTNVLEKQAASTPQQ
ncbi:MAG: DUF1573 domain-containing protein [Bacteroidota bacterium]